LDDHRQGQQGRYPLSARALVGTERRYRPMAWPVLTKGGKFAFGLHEKDPLYPWKQTFCRAAEIVSFVPETDVRASALGLCV
jgi:hypothetical protein